MLPKPDYRESRREDVAAIESLYPRAFPDEDLVPLVRELLDTPDVVLSLVASAAGQIAGHGIFTRCVVDGSADTVALLGPLAVDPSWQRQGIGTAIVRAGFGRLRDAGVNCVCVLGDPGYYGRLGFARETGIRPPYALPPEWHNAWQSVSLDGTSSRASGVLGVPPPWRDRALWAP